MIQRLVNAVGGPFVVIAALVLTGCTASRLSPLEADSVPVPGGDGGYVLASVTIGGGRNAEWSLRALGTLDERSMSALAEGALGFRDQFPEDESQRGRLIMLAMPPGHYELTNWALRLHTRAHQSRWLQPAALPPIPFTVKSNEVLYIGNLHVDVETAEPSEVVPDALLPIRGASARIEDRSERDLALYRERYPQFTELPVRPSVKSRPEWALRVTR